MQFGWRRRDLRRGRIVAGRDRFVGMEPLERRVLMSASCADSAAFNLEAPPCPVCGAAGCGGHDESLIRYEIDGEVFELYVDPIIGGDAAADDDSPAGGGSALHPLTAIPVLHSFPGAPATIYLDFDGHIQGNWGTYNNVSTPPYDIDGDITTFSDTELDRINRIWQRVSEDFAPFNINVTTVEPASFANRVGLRVAIGGSWTDWFGQEAGGVAYVDSFNNSQPNVVFAFAKNLSSGSDKTVAEASSHEAGHAFGLRHQSTYNESGVKLEEYNPGGSGWAPIMGVSYNQPLSTWHDGPNSVSATSYQDDMALIARSTNGFGYRTDDHGGTIVTATAFTVNGSSVSAAGVITQMTDVDAFGFSTLSGNISFAATVVPVGPNLDIVLELLNSDGQSVKLSNPSGQSASLQATVTEGQYTLLVSATGQYGRVGKYTVTGTIIDPTPPAVDDAYEMDEDTTLSVGPSFGVLSNDRNNGGPTPNAMLVVPPSHGQLTLNANGSFIYIPDADYHGTDSFRYSNGVGVEADVLITIRSLPDLPIARADHYDVDADQTLVVGVALGVLGNDTDGDGDPLTASLLTSPAHGQLTFNANGSFTYAPDLGYSGDDTFTYRALDGVGVTFVPRGAVWKYLDNGSNQGTAWREPTFDDSLWASGPAQLGYGEGDEATVVSFGPSSNNKYPTTYFRHAFTLADASTVISMTLGLVRDDGAAVYLNGMEVVRVGLAANAAYNTYANTTVNGASENVFTNYAVNPALLVNGVNVLAVEMHQVTASSSDLSFDLDLKAVVGSTPATVTITVHPPGVPGDVTGDGLVNAADIDALFAAVNAGATDPLYDLNGDTLISRADVDHLVLNLLGAQYGDANLDRRVDITDLSIVGMRFGQSNVGWANGDFTGDRAVTITDVSIVAIQYGFDQSPPAAPTAESSPTRRERTVAMLGLNDSPAAHAAHAKVWDHIRDALDAVRII